METAQVKTSDKISLRPGEAGDAEALGRICYEAFRTISEAHNFPPDFPAPEAAVGMINMALNLPAIYSVGAENWSGQAVGSNFLWEFDSVSGVGPITIDPAVQNSSIGRTLMEDVIRRSDEQGHPSVRLVQAAYHNRSLSLYTKLGFDTVEPLSLMQGDAIGRKIDGYSVRQMTDSDLDEVDALTLRVHGHSRRNEVAAAISQGTANLIEHDGRITGYTTTVGFFGHTVGESNEDIKALIASAESFPGSGFLLPSRNGELMRWCFENGLRVIQPMTLMARGLYQKPRGAFLPSILY